MFSEFCSFSALSCSFEFVWWCGWWWCGWWWDSQRLLSLNPTTVIVVLLLGLLLLLFYDNILNLKVTLGGKITVKIIKQNNFLDKASQISPVETLRWMMVNTTINSMWSHIILIMVVGLTKSVSGRLLEEEYYQKKNKILLLFQQDSDQRWVGSWK